MKSLAFAALTALCLAASASATPEPTVEDLKRDIRTLRDQIDDLKKTREFDLKMLADRLDRIERLIERVATIGPASRSEFTPSVTGRRGIVRLENRMAITGYVTLDGVAYSVPPLSTRTLPDVPPGAISYTLGGEGLSTGPEMRSRVNPGERLTITILPPG